MRGTSDWLTAVRRRRSGQWRNTNWIRFAVFLFTIAVLTIVSGCSSSGDGEAAEQSEPPTQRGIDFSKCDVVNSELVASTTQCQDELYLTAVRSGDYDGLADISDTSLASFARGLCTYAGTLTDLNDAQLPFFGDLVTSTANSWGVKPVEVESVYHTTRLMCPDEYEVLRRLPRSSTAIQFDLVARGSGTADITYLLPDGTSEKLESVELPWTQSFNIGEPATISVTVVPLGDSTAGCQIIQDHAVIDEYKISPAPADCEVSAAEIDRQIVARRDGDGG